MEIVYHRSGFFIKLSLMYRIIWIEHELYNSEKAPKI